MEEEDTQETGADAHDDAAAAGRGEEEGRGETAGVTCSATVTALLLLLAESTGA